MKIAIPTKNNLIDNHFGHCDSYMIYSVDDKKHITGQETLASPEGCGCKSNIASVLQEKGVTIMLAGNMGNGALNKLNMHGITVYRGCSGNIKETVQSFLSGNIEDSGESCHMHEDEHTCNHNNE